jgi:hypothetical protein
MGKNAGKKFSNQQNQQQIKRKKQNVEIGSGNVNSKEYKLKIQWLLFAKTRFEMVRHNFENPYKIWRVLQ